MTEYRASFDATIRFSNGGDLTAHGFRVDVPSPEVGEDEIAALFVASLGLLMTDAVELSNVEVFAEPHKGTRGGPSDRGGAEPGASGRLVELSHVIRAGMITYPGLPGPEITPYLSREASRERYAPGTEFAFDRLTLVGNTATYLDAPYHRFPGGADLSAIPLARTADLPAVVARVTGAGPPGIDVGALAALDVRGRAVLLHTGDDARFGTPAYAEDRHFLTRAGAAWLADHDAALVGIDALNIDDTADAERPAHTLLLAAGIPVIEHLTGLEQLPPTGARFTAVPLRIEGFGTIPVRAFARLPAQLSIIPILIDGNRVLDADGRDWVSTDWGQHRLGSAETGICCEQESRFAWRKGDRLMLRPWPERGAVAVQPPGSAPGYWAGAPCAVAGDGEIFLAYRLRRPVGRGRGYAVAVAQCSLAAAPRAADGEWFETLLSIAKEEMATESLERPALVRTPAGRWRLYLSCATFGTKHWRVEMTEAAHPGEFDVRRREVILPGDAKTGVKDPVIRYLAGRWHLWASCHPLTDPLQADQMTTEYATSSDGLAWTWHGTALSGTPGQWDARGTRVTAVDFGQGVVTAYYDGRASAAENFEERTGVASGTDPAALSALPGGPLASSPHLGGGLRYLDVVSLPGGRRRLYYELTQPDGSHALVTEAV